MVLDASKVSKGYGFVRFTDPSEQQRALVEMPGQVCGLRPIRVSIATPRHRPPAIVNLDPTCTTVFIGGLVPEITEQDLIT